jgi:hypothetical protein
MTPFEVLSQIATGLADVPPLKLIEQSMPLFHADAVAWARRLPLWDEYRGQYSDQVISLARIISQRAMREFGLALTEDGRVIDRYQQLPRSPRAVELAFPLVVGGKEVQVQYSLSDLPSSIRDGFAFVAEVNPLSDTGYWHQFASRDAVEAVGGPKAFAALCAEAKLADRLSEFNEQFQGRFPASKRPSGRKPHKAGNETPPILGTHTAEVVEAPPPDAEGDRSHRQGKLF